MDKASTAIAIISGAVGIIAGIVAGISYVARTLTAPLKLQIDNLQAQIIELKKAVERETEEIKRTVERETEELKRTVEAQDERHRRHTGDTEKHTSAEWRQALDRRLERIEGHLIKMASPK